MYLNFRIFGFMNCTALHCNSFFKYNSLFESKKKKNNKIYKTECENT